MKALNKQTVLKGALLAVLATNISWQTAASYSTDLASELGAAGKLPPPPPPVTIKAAPANPTAAKAGNSGAKPDAAARAKPAAAPEVATAQESREETLLKLKACDREYVVTFFEEKVKDQTHVRGEFQVNGNNLGATTKGPFTLARFKASTTSQEKFLTAFAAEAEKVCAASVAVDPSAKRADGDLAQERARADREANRIGLDILECKRDTSGKLLKNEDKLDCHMDRISSDEMQDDTYEEGDRRSRRKASSADRRFERSVDYVMEEVVALLTSDDAEDRRDGKALKKDLEESLRDARSNGVVSRALVTKSVARVKALEDGLNVSARTTYYQRQATQIDQQIAQLQQQMPMAQMQSPMYAQMMQQQIQSLQQQKRTLGTTSMPQDSLFTGYSNLSAQGIVQAPEFNAFTDSYTSLMRLLSGNQSPTQTQAGQLPGVSMAPSADAQAFRSAPGSNLNARSNGMSMPAFPQLNQPQAAPMQQFPIPAQTSSLQQPGFQSRAF